MAPFTDQLMLVFVALMWIAATLFFLRRLRPHTAASIVVGTGWRVFDLQLFRTKYSISAIPWGISFELDDFPFPSLVLATLLGSVVTVGLGRVHTNKTNSW
jgi:hypothetical protein